MNLSINRLPVAAFRPSAAGCCFHAWRRSAETPLRQGSWFQCPTKAMVVVLLAGTLSAYGFVGSLDPAGNILRWNLVSTDLLLHTNVVNPGTRAIRYFMAADAYSTQNTAAELNAVRAAFDQWQAIPGTGLKFEFAGLVGPSVDVNASDHTNVVFWANTSTLVNGGLSDIRGFLGYTFYSVSNENHIVEADIVLNGVDYAWFTDLDDTQNPGRLVEGTVTHEIGHFLGLEHSPVGGATMFTRGTSGVDTQIGLSSDEIAAAQFLYPSPAALTNLGALQGLVTIGGAGVFGAAVVLEDAAGNVAAGTVTGSDGSYLVPALSQGNYQARVTPLDPNTSFRLVSGLDISQDYTGANVNFLPTSNVAAVVTAGLTNTLDFAVTNSTPAFRISFIRAPTDDPGLFTAANAPAAIHPGQSNMTVGVYSTSLLLGAQLNISGDGLTVGATSRSPNPFGNGLNAYSVPLSVAGNATPGLRSFVLRHISGIAFANGFLEVLPPHPDYNFDGLDDTFQRRYFPLFTTPEAGPDADPDGDQFNNRSEYIAGTVPTNTASRLTIERVTLSTNGTTVNWQSVPGKRYQVFSRANLSTGSWQPAGSPATASGDTTQLLEPSATNNFRFYRVQVLP